MSLRGGGFSEVGPGHSSLGNRHSLKKKKKGQEEVRETDFEWHVKQSGQVKKMEDKKELSV